MRKGDENILLVVAEDIDAALRAALSWRFVHGDRGTPRFDWYLLDPLPRSLELREQSGRDRRERAVQHTGWGGSRSMNSAGKHMLGTRQQGEHTRAYRVVHGGHHEDLVGNDPRGRRRVALLDVREQLAERLAHVRYAIRVALHPAQHGLRWLQR